MLLAPGPAAVRHAQVGSVHFLLSFGACRFPAFISSDNTPFSTHLNTLPSAVVQHL